MRQLTSYTDYTNEVMEYLEYLNYPDYVSHFRAEDVATTLWRTIVNVHENTNFSHRLCALIIFGLTWNKLKTGEGIINQIIH